MTLLLCTIFQFVFKYCLVAYSCTDEVMRLTFVCYERGLAKLFSFNLIIAQTQFGMAQNNIYVSKPLYF